MTLMKTITSLFLPLLLLSCQESDLSALSNRPRDLSPEERQTIDATLATQVIGKELAGRTSWLNDEGFYSGSLDKAPQRYLLYFSASW